MSHTTVVDATLTAARLDTDMTLTLPNEYGTVRVTHVIPLATGMHVLVCGRRITRTGPFPVSGEPLAPDWHWLYRVDDRVTTHYCEHLPPLQPGTRVQVIGNLQSRSWEPHDPRLQGRVVEVVSGPWQGAYIVADPDTHLEDAVLGANLIEVSS